MCGAGLFYLCFCSPLPTKGIAFFPGLGQDAQVMMSSTPSFPVPSLESFQLRHMTPSLLHKYLEVGGSQEHVQQSKTEILKCLSAWAIFPSSRHQRKQKLIAMKRKNKNHLCIALAARVLSGPWN